MPECVRPSVTFDGATGALEGENTLHSRKTLAEVGGIFRDQDALRALPPDTVVYRVDAHSAVPEGTSGGLFFGVSHVLSGKVGREFFMTKGHFHARRETAEYYWGIAGTGVLLLMDESGACRAERVEKGSLHYIAGHVAHRLVNTGAEELTVGACWYADAGHDYGSVATDGFPVRVLDGGDGENGDAVCFERADGAGDVRRFAREGN